MHNIERRQAIQTISTSLAGIAFSAMTARESLALAHDNPLAPKQTHFPATAKRVIMLFMNGAPSHVDTLDYKPDLIKAGGKSAGGRGQLMGPISPFRKRGRSGLWISDLFSNVAEHADDLCLIRSMHTDQPNHPTAERAAHTGSAQFVRPSLGAWSVYGLGTENTDLPGFVMMGQGGRAGQVCFGSSFLPARYQATTVNTGAESSAGGRGRQGNGRNPNESIPNIANSTLDKRAQRTQLDLLSRLNQATLEQEVHQRQVEGIMQSYELAFRMQSSMPQVMDLSEETQKTKEMYGIGEGATNSFGTQCLIARRMAEAGVRFIEIATTGWDHHTQLADRLPKSCEAVDRPIAGLLADLKRRDMLKDTLVIFAGEFGRTPHGSGGRGHNNRGYTTWMAGGGVKGGFSYGSTDELGAEATDNRMSTHDWHATILHLLGLDHEKLTYQYAGRPFRLTNVAGKVAKDIVT